MLWSFNFGRNISTSYAEIENFIGTTTEAAQRAEDTFSRTLFDTSFLWEVSTIKAMDTIADHAITEGILTLLIPTTKSFVSSQGSKIEEKDAQDLTIGGEVVLSTLTGISDAHWIKLDKLSRLLSSPLIRNLSIHVSCALWFAWHGPDPFGYFAPYRFMANLAIYTGAQIFSMFTQSVPGVQIFNLYRVHCTYCMLGLVPASQALFFTILNQFLDWSTEVHTPKSYWEKTRNFIAKHKHKIKVGLWATNTLCWGVSKLFNWNSSSAISSNKVYSCPKAISTLNDAIGKSTHISKVETLPTNATVKMVKKAYRALSKIFHPDMQHHLPEDKKILDAKSIWLSIVNAKDFFMDKCKK